MFGIHSNKNLSCSLLQKALENKPVGHAKAEVDYLLSAISVQIYKQ